jgi:hypothetical protein
MHAPIALVTNLYLKNKILPINSVLNKYLHKLIIEYNLPGDFNSYK